MTGPGPRGRGVAPVEVVLTGEDPIARLFSDLGPDPLWVDLSLGPHAPNQAAGEVCAQLGLTPVTPGRGIGAHGAGVSTADRIGVLIDGETTGHGPTLAALSLVEQAAQALAAGPARDLILLAPIDGAPLGAENELFLYWLSEQAGVGLKVLCPAPPGLPPHWPVQTRSAAASDRPALGLAPGVALAPGLLGEAEARALAGGDPSAVGLEAVAGGFWRVPLRARLAVAGHESDARAEALGDIAELSADPWRRAWALAGGDDPAAVPRLLDCAWRALDQASHGVAQRLVEAAMRLTASPVDRARLLAAAQGMRIGVQDFAAVKAVPDPAPDLPDELRGRLLQYKGWGLVMSGEGEAADGYLAAARALLPADTREGLYLLNISALTHLRNGRDDEALALELQIGEALGRLDRLDWQLGYVNALNTARLHLRRGELDLAETKFLEAFDTSDGLRTLGDHLALSHYLGRVAEKRGDRSTARRLWLDACLVWLASPRPEAVPLRAARLLVGFKLPPRHELAEAMSRGIAEELAKAWDRPIPEDGPAPAVVGPDRRHEAQGWRAIGGGGCGVLATPGRLDEPAAGPWRRRLGRLAAQLVGEAVGAALDADETLLVDDRQGRALAHNQLELAETALSCGAPTLQWDGGAWGVDPSRLTPRLILGFSRAVEACVPDGDGCRIDFRRYRAPVWLPAEEAFWLEAARTGATLADLAGADAAPEAFSELLQAARTLEDARILTLRLPASALRPAAPADDFRERGYMRLEGFLGIGELETLERLAARAVQASPQARRGAAAADELVWLYRPELLEQSLADSAVAARARACAAPLLGVEAGAVDLSWRIFHKPARTGSAVPWHQDAAYRPPGSAPALNIWIPLQDATPERGCLYFVPGSHRGPLLPHRSSPIDPSGLTLETDLPDGAAPEAWPVAAGSASVHASGALHHSPPNRSDSDRCAVVIVCEAQPLSA